MDRKTQLGVLARMWPPAKKGDVWGIDFPDCPGCVTSGATELEVIDNAHEALIFHIEGMIEDGEKIPLLTPGWKAAKMRESDRKKGEDWIATYIVIPKPQKQVRFNVMASAAELVRIDQAAKTAGKNRSRFLVDAALDSSSE